MAPIVRLAEQRQKRQPAPVYFDRHDLNALLGLYSRHVARGEWRDYALGHDPGVAHFSVFRHTHETPLFTITKRQQGGKALYAVYDGTRKLRQSGRLTEALAALNKPLRLIQ
ncbi:DUF2794 domain-containing protein [Novispirillum sp. DQ9]|uniref:DUF2794 domain-containing protein n=1 Tax=Novispirillum sp. DQ9 TaxID=3398612 RepID=UPI003C79C40E